MAEAGQSPSIHDFTQPQPFISDVVLIVEGQRLHVNKACLALHSPVFHTLFFSDFSERSKEEVVLKEVGADKFVDLLSHIYPTPKQVLPKNVESLLKTADQFQVQSVLDKCTSFLQITGSGSITLAKKFLLADRYRLLRLQKWCMDQLKGRNDVWTLKDTDEYTLLSDKVKVTLLEKALYMS